MNIEPLNSTHFHESRNLSSIVSVIITDKDIVSKDVDLKLSDFIWYITRASEEICVQYKMLKNKFVKLTKTV